MPVIVKGKQIIEKATGKVVGTGKTAASAQKSAGLRNALSAEAVRPKRRPQKRKKPTLTATVRG